MHVNNVSHLKIQYGENFSKWQLRMTQNSTQTTALPSILSSVSSLTLLSLSLLCSLIDIRAHTISQYSSLLSLHFALLRLYSPSPISSLLYFHSFFSPPLIPQISPPCIIPLVRFPIIPSTKSRTSIPTFKSILTYGSPLW